MAAAKLTLRPGYNQPIVSALSSLPPEYQLARAIDLRQQPRLLLELNLVGLGLLLLSGWLFLWLAVRLRPEAGLRLSLRLSDSLVVVLGIVIAFAAVLLLHELVHGTCFWLITRRPPRFGVQLAYAYAAAPQWYIPRNPYLIVGMAPLVVITLVGVALLPVLPAALLLPWIFALTINASGSIGDLYIIAWLLTRPASALVNDHGDRIYIYLPEAR
jgi:hypothetical protein